MFNCLRKSVFSLVSASVLLVACGGEGQAPQSSAPPPVPDASTVLANVSSALGSSDLTSITYEGYAWRIRNSFRQTRTASPPWIERDEITGYVKTLDLAGTRSLARGETFAQNLFFDPRVAGAFIQNINAESNWAQQLEFWLTPWGFLEGAGRYGASVSRTSMNGNNYTVLSWTTPDSVRAPSGLAYTVNGYINERNQISSVETWVEDAFMGDLHVRNVYRDYENMNGLMVPRTMEQYRAGGAVFGVHIRNGAANPADLAQLLTPPAAPAGPGFAGAPPAPQREPIEQLSDGVYLIHDGYVALVNEFADYVTVFEAGQSEARGETILERVRSITDKPIRYLVISHPHADHTAGVVPFVREGITILTHESNVEFLRMGLSTPRTLLGQETLNPQIQGVGSLMVLEDESGMRLELHHVPNRHSEGTLVAYMPDQLLFQADFTLPLGGAQANPFVQALARYVADNGLQFEDYLAVHAAAVPQTMADLMQALPAQ